MQNRLSRSWLEPLRHVVKSLQRAFDGRTYSGHERNPNEWSDMWPMAVLPGVNNMAATYHLTGYKMPRRCLCDLVVPRSD